MSLYRIGMVTLVVCTALAFAGCETGEVANGEEPDQEVAVEALERWLEGQDAASILRVPIGLKLTPLGVQRAWIMDGDSGGEGLAVRLDDSRLGVGLAERVRSLCEEDSCEIWVRATKGPAMPELSPTEADEPVLTVISVEGRITEAQPAISVEQ